MFTDQKGNCILQRFILCFLKQEMFSILSSLDQNSWMMFRGRNVQAGAGAVMGAGDCSSGKMISYQDGP